MDTGESIIETGVDKLVKIVKERGRIALTDAAKELGVSVTVIQEWVDFLEEEGIISVEYKFTKPYLVEKKLSKKEVETKAKEFTGKKEVFVRKAEVSLGFLEKQAEDLKKVKGEFDKLKNDLGLNLDNVRNELKELESYQQLKEELVKQAEYQRNEARIRMKEFTKQILNEQRKYMYLVTEIKRGKEELEKESSDAKSIEGSERILNSKLNELKNMIGLMEKRISNETIAIKNSESHIGRLKQIADSIKQRIEEEKSVIEPLIQKSKEQEKKVLELQDRILEKITQNEKNVANAKTLTNRFKTLFEKKLSALDLIYKINKDRDELEKGLMELIKKAKSFQLSMKKGDVGKEMLNLEKKFSEVDKKKNVFEEELKKLIYIFNK